MQVETNKSGQTLWINFVFGHKKKLKEWAWNYSNSNTIYSSEHSVSFKTTDEHRLKRILITFHPRMYQMRKLMWCKSPCNWVIVIWRVCRGPECKQHLSQGLLRSSQVDSEADGNEDSTNHQERQPGLQERHEAAGHQKHLQTSEETQTLQQRYGNYITHPLGTFHYSSIWDLH